MEVFIPWDGKGDAVPFLEKCLYGWSDVRFAQPMVIGVVGNKQDIKFRVAADGLAKNDYYILSDVDAIPEETYVISAINKHLAVRPRLGLALIRPVFELGGRVRVVRKGLIERWPEQTSKQYDREHAEAVI